MSRASCGSAARATAAGASAAPSRAAKSSSRPASSRAPAGRGPLGRLAQQAGAVEKFDAHLLAGGGLLLQSFTPGGEVVDPGLDGVVDVALFDDRDAGPPGVVAQRHHARLADLRLVRQPVAHHRLQGVVAVDEDVGGHGEHFPHRPFGGKASPLHLRGEIFDDDSASAVGHGPFRPESGRSRPSPAAVLTSVRTPPIIQG